MKNFKVGDKVIGNHPTRYGITKLGWKGVVVKVHDDGSFDAKEKEIDPLTFRWLEPKYFNNVNTDEKIIITHDGKTTTARLFNGKKLVKTATAKCAPEDTFDFNVGANLAFERLNPKYEVVEKVTKITEPPKYYNGKVICVDNTSNINIHTVGKIYEFVDGYLTADNGWEYPSKRVESFKEWCGWSASKWIELVE